MTKIAILDDYQNAALKSADWQSLSGADIKVFNYFIEPGKRIDEQMKVRSCIRGGGATEHYCDLREKGRSQ